MRAGVPEMVAAAAAGFHATVFAYGQTGASPEVSCTCTRADLLNRSGVREPPQSTAPAISGAAAGCRGAQH